MAVDEGGHTGFYPFEVTPAHLAYTLLGGFTVVFGMFSSFFKEKLYLGEAPIATIFGIILGPHVANLIDPYSWGGGDHAVTDEITLEITRVVIAISVFAVGVELPKKYMLRHWRTMIILLLPCMLWGWFISALLMWALIPGLKFLSCLLIAAAVTPTDPILAQSVIGGTYAEKHVPAHIRHMLSAESGSNDGAAFPFLYIALYLTLDASPGHAVGEWFYATIAYEIVLGTVLGSLLGWAARKVMTFSEQRKYIDRQSFVAQYVSLALLSMGGTVLLGSDDLLSAFACGCAFAWNGYFNRQTEDAVFSNVVDLLFNSAAFIYIGTLLPFPDFNNHELGLDWWRLFALAICILVARRIPSILALYKFMPDIKTFREACFTGWFGPMGVGAVFISTLARHSLPYGDPDADTAQVDRIRAIITPITLFLVLSSVLSHGLSIPFFSLGRRVHSITYTWSRQPSIRDNQPAWTSQVRHVQPGQSIIINRDEDAEEGDVGLNNREKTNETSSDRTKREEIEMSEKRNSSDESNRGSGSGAERDQEGDDGAMAERSSRDDDVRPGTPSIAEYREGNDLIVERKPKDGGEVEVEVRKNHFAAEESAIHKFTHPKPLETHEVDKIREVLPQIERFDSSTNLQQHLTRPESTQSRHSSRADASRDRDDEDEGEPPQSESGRRVKYDEPAKEQTMSNSSRTTFQGIRQRIFGHRSSSPTHEHKAEAGQSPTNVLSPTPSYSSRQTRTPLELTRTQSISRTIRFADGARNDSDTAPGPGGGSNYGNSQAGFKKTPGLAMFRTTSIKEDEA